MIVLRLIGKVLLMPVFIAMMCSWLIVKMLVAIYGFTRGFIALGIGILIVATAICYQDWK